VTEEGIGKIMGEHIRRRRKMLGMTSKELAAKINISYQQLYKYEIGKDRLPAVTLFTLSHILHTDLADFFGAENGFTESVRSNELYLLAKAYCAINDEKLRRAACNFIKALSD
jgi:transcriptional regulator with XRE-family HTH domain